MRSTLFAGVVAAASIVAGAAMAQQLAPSVPVTGGLVQMGGVGVPQISGYTFQWSQNPAPVSSFTSDPGFVEHSHGRP